MGQQEFIHGLHNLESRHRGCVATIGSFDGVHRGHMAVIQQVKDQAKALSLPSLVMVFEPQPPEFFSRNNAPPRLMRLREKVCALFAAGVDRVLCLKFNDALRRLTAAEYIERVLIRGIGVKYLVIGDDFRFGCDRSGDFDMLCRAGEKNGFEVHDTKTQLEGGERISSTRVRQMLAADDILGAEHLLGKPVTLIGRVIYGKQIGRTLGFPTANVDLGHHRLPVSGVFTVEVARVDCAKNIWQGMANIGFRPTLERTGKALLEVHIFDEDIDLYGQFIQVRIREKIRDEQRFIDMSELKAQIEKDRRTAERFFARLRSEN